MDSEFKKTKTKTGLTNECKGNKPSRKWKGSTVLEWIHFYLWRLYAPASYPDYTMTLSLQSGASQHPILQERTLYLKRSPFSPPPALHPKTLIWFSSLHLPLVFCFLFSLLTPLGQGPPLSSVPWYLQHGEWYLTCASSSNCWMNKNGGMLTTNTIFLKE